MKEEGWDALKKTYEKAAEVSEELKVITALYKEGKDMNEADILEGASDFLDDCLTFVDFLLSTHGEVK